MSKITIVETQRQPTRVVVTQSLDVGVTTIVVETVVAPTIDVVKMGVLIDLKQNWVVDRVESRLEGN